MIFWLSASNAYDKENVLRQKKKKSTRTRTVTTNKYLETYL